MKSRDLHPLRAALAAALALAGCAHQSELVPDPGARLEPGRPGTAVETVTGVRVQVDAGAWRGAWLDDVLAPMRVNLSNDSQRPLRVTYAAFSLGAPNGFRLALPTMTGTKRRATGHTEVKTYQPTAYDETADGPTLFENRVNETFTGDVEGEGAVRVIQAARKDGSATFVGIERVRGAVGGRKGSFLLQINGTDLGRERKAEWFVVPGSGTGDLKGLRGEGGFKAQRGEHGSIWLEYYFE